MNASRRQFLKIAGMSAPALTFPGSDNDTNLDSTVQMDPWEKTSQHVINNGWLNVEDCGASGSRFQTVATVKAGSRQIIVEDIGDFKTGQGVMISKCNIQYEKIRMWGQGERYRNMKPVNNSVEIRGYDGTAGSWIIYMLDIAPSSKPAFRWTDDLGRTWHDAVTITNDWQPLNKGIEVKLNERDWESGYVIAFGARDQLITRIEKIEGNVITVADEPNRTVNDAVVRHNDTEALQSAIDRAIKENLNIFIPAGHYILARTIRVKDAGAITIEGASSADTILDISEGEGACLTLSEGTDVIVRNFRMLGFMGFEERDKAGYINTRGSTYIWGFSLKHCNAMTIINTERVLIENCHASRMSGECFVSYGRSRGAVKPGESYTQWITYRRCSVIDCARNAFNDTQCNAENTSILNCRIIDVGGNSWESASRFVKFSGNYMRNAGVVGIGNLGPANRDNTYPELGSGQHIVADNVFEGGTPYGGCAIRSSRGATQVIVRNNLFINYNSSGVEVTGTHFTNEYQSANTIITGNIFDMTCIGQESRARSAINISCNDTIISNNQIYVRGKTDPLVTGIKITEPAMNAIVHDNLVRNCGSGILSGPGESRVGEVIDTKTFKRLDGPSGLPLERIQPGNTKGWYLIWKNDKESKQYSGISEIEYFDPETLNFKLKEPWAMKQNDRFEVNVPSMKWTVHNNTVTDCLHPLILNSYGSKTCLFYKNQISRGNTSNVQKAIEIHGSFQFFDNFISGFNEEKSVAILLYTDNIGRANESYFKGNIFENCFSVVIESNPGLLKASFFKENIVID